MKQNEFSIPPHALTNFEIQKYYKNESRFNGVYSRDNLPEHSSTEIKDGAYIINLDEYSDIGTHWVALYAQNNNNNVLKNSILLVYNLFLRKLKHLLIVLRHLLCIIKTLK